MELFECGFFEALQSRVLDINYEENPYPALAAVRSIVTATKLRYSLRNVVMGSTCGSL